MRFGFVMPESARNAERLITLNLITSFRSVKADQILPKTYNCCAEGVTARSQIVFKLIPSQPLQFFRSLSRPGRRVRIIPNRAFSSSDKS